MREPGGDGRYHSQWIVRRGETISPLAQQNASLDLTDLFGVDMQ